MDQLTAAVENLPQASDSAATEPAPELSVVVPTYNERANIPLTGRPAAAQRSPA